MKNIASQVDGFCMEHVMAFEDLIWNAKSAPFHSVKNLKNLIHLRNELVKQNKYVLSKYVMVILWISYLIFPKQKEFPRASWRKTLAKDRFYQWSSTSTKPPLSTANHQLRDATGLQGYYN